MTVSHRLYLLALLGTPCAVLLVLAVIYLPGWCWVPIFVSAAPVLSQAIQAWLRLPVRGER